MPVPPHNRKCRCEPGMGSSCLIPRTRTQARCIHGYYSPKQPPSHGNWEPRMEMLHSTPRAGWQMRPKACFTHLGMFTSLALSSIMSNTVRRTQKCIRESVLPHQALRCYLCWISSTAYRTAGKRHLVAWQGMLGNRTCFMYHLASEMWATARAREEAKHFVIFPQLVSWSKMGVTNRL